MKFVLGLIVGIALTFGLAYLLQPKESKSVVKVDAEVLSQRLEKCSDLTTAKFTINGKINREETYDWSKGIGFLEKLSKKSFNLYYVASALVGVDLSKAKTQIDSSDVNISKVKITLPKATLQNIVMYSDSLRIETVQRSIINFENKKDATEALQDAEKHARANLNLDSLISVANKQAVESLTTLLSPMTMDANGNPPYLLEVSIEQDSIAKPAAL